MNYIHHNCLQPKLNFNYSEVIEKPICLCIFSFNNTNVSNIAFQTHQNSPISISFPKSLINSTINPITTTFPFTTHSLVPIKFHGDSREGGLHNDRSLDQLGTRGSFQPIERIRDHTRVTRPAYV